jgi:putative flippase GtrA
MSVLRYLTNSPQLIRFLLVGGTGTLLNLGVTWLSVTAVFGVKKYFWGAVLGLAANIIYNFTLYTISVFKTTENHHRRLSIFALYSICIAGLYLVLVRTVTAVVGAEYYLLVSAGAILFFAVVNYIVLKKSIFAEHMSPIDPF